MVYLHQIQSDIVDSTEAKKLYSPESGVISFGKKVHMTSAFLFVTGWMKATQNGAVYVYHLDNGGTVALQKLVASDARAGDLFGKNC